MCGYYGSISHIDILFLSSSSSFVSSLSFIPLCAHRTHTLPPWLPPIMRPSALVFTNRCFFVFLVYSWISYIRALSLSSSGSSSCSVHAKHTHKLTGCIILHVCSCSCSHMHIYIYTMHVCVCIRTKHVVDHVRVLETHDLLQIIQLLVTGQVGDAGLDPA